MSSAGGVKPDPPTAARATAPRPGDLAYLRGLLYRPDKGLRKPVTRAPAHAGPSLPKTVGATRPRTRLQPAGQAAPYATRTSAMRKDDLYDLVLVLAHNDDPVVPVWARPSSATCGSRTAEPTAGSRGPDAAMVPWRRSSPRPGRATPSRCARPGRPGAAPPRQPPGLPPPPRPSSPGLQLQLRPTVLGQAGQAGSGRRPGSAALPRPRSSCLSRPVMTAGKLVVAGRKPLGLYRRQHDVAGQDERADGRSGTGRSDGGTIRGGPARTPSQVRPARRVVGDDLGLDHRDGVVQRPRRAGRRWLALSRYGSGGDGRAHPPPAWSALAAPPPTKWPKHRGGDGEKTVRPSPGKVGSPALRVSPERRRLVHQEQTRGWLQGRGRWRRAGSSPPERPRGSAGRRRATPSTSTTASSKPDAAQRPTGRRFGRPVAEVLLDAHVREEGARPGKTQPRPRCSIFRSGRGWSRTAPPRKGDTAIVGVMAPAGSQGGALAGPRRRKGP